MKSFDLIKIERGRWNNKIHDNHITHLNNTQPWRTCGVAPEDTSTGYHKDATIWTPRFIWKNHCKDCAMNHTYVTITIIALQNQINVLQPPRIIWPFAALLCLLQSSVCSLPISTVLAWQHCNWAPFISLYPSLFLSLFKNNRLEDRLRMFGNLKFQRMQTRSRFKRLFIQPSVAAQSVHYCM